MVRFQLNCGTPHPGLESTFLTLSGPAHGAVIRQLHKLAEERADDQQQVVGAADALHLLAMRSLVQTFDFFTGE